MARTLTVHGKELKPNKVNFRISKSRRSPEERINVGESKPTNPARTRSPLVEIVSESQVNFDCNA